MKKFSALKNEIELLELHQKHELKKLEVEHRYQKAQIIDKCTHTFDDGISARVEKGTQWDYYSKCGICGKNL